MKNKYIYRSLNFWEKFREILKFFCLDLEAIKVAEICKISEKTINKIFKQIRIKMAESCEKQAKLSGEIEIDESYFEAKRVHGKRGAWCKWKNKRSDATKWQVSCVAKRNKVKRLCLAYLNETAKFILVKVKNCSASELLPILREYSEFENSTIYSDTPPKAYDELVDYGVKANYMVKHCKNKFAKQAKRSA